MAGTWKTMVNFAVRLPNRAGELARFTEQLQDAGINLIGLWGYAPGQDDPWMSCVPEAPEAFRDFVLSSGLEFEEGKALYLGDADKPGVLVDTLKRIAEADLNIDAIESVASGGRFGCFIWTDEHNWADLEAVLP